MRYDINNTRLSSAEHNGLGGEEELSSHLIDVFSRAGKEMSPGNLPDPIDYLKEVMHQRGLRKRDLKVYIGSSGYVSSVLNRKKPLSLKMIRNLHTYLDIPAEILIQPYDCH